MQSNTMQKSLPSKVKWLYATGETGQQIVVGMFGMFMLFFYTNVFGISPAAAGTMFLIARVWDAINDPIIGAIIDGTNTKQGRCRPYLIKGAIPLAVFMILTFTAPDLSPTMKLVWAYVTYIGQGMIYTATNTAYITLMSRIAKTADERIDMRSKIVIVATIGTWVSTSQTMNLVNFFGDSGTNLQKGFFITICIYSSIIVAGYLLVAHSVRDYDKTETFEKQKIDINTKEIRKDLFALFKNPMMIYVCLMNFLYVLLSFIPMGALVYYLTYNIKKPEAIAIVQTIATISYLIVGFTITKLSQKLGKTNLAIMAISMAIICYIIRYITNDSSFILMLICGGLVEMGFAYYGNLNSPFLMDAVDYNEYMTGRRTDALIISTFNFITKLCIGISGAVVGYLLGLTGFDQTLETQPDSVLLGLKNMMFLIPGVLAVFFVVILLKYKKHQNKMLKILKELEIRRNQKQESI